MDVNELETTEGKGRFSWLKNRFNDLMNGGLSVGFAIVGLVIIIPSEVLIRGVVQEFHEMTLVEHLITFGILGLVLVSIIFALVALSLIAPTLGLLFGGLGMLRPQGRTALNVGGLVGCSVLLLYLVIRHNLLV